MPTLVPTHLGIRVFSGDTHPYRHVLIAELEGKKVCVREYDGNNEFYVGMFAGIEGNTLKIQTDNEVVLIPGVLTTNATRDLERPELTINRYTLEVSG